MFPVPHFLPGTVAHLWFGKDPECGRNSCLGYHDQSFRTTIWDYIHRGMPLGREGSLKPDEVYSIVAFLLFKNGVTPEDTVLDELSLPKVKMPNRDGFAPLPEWKHATPRLQGYP